MKGVTVGSVHIVCDGSCTPLERTEFGSKDLTCACDCMECK